METFDVVTHDQTYSVLDLTQLAAIPVRTLSLGDCRQLLDLWMAARHPEAAPWTRLGRKVAVDMRNNTLILDGCAVRSWYRVKPSNKFNEYVEWYERLQKMANSIKLQIRAVEIENCGRRALEVNFYAGRQHVPVCVELTVDTQGAKYNLRCDEAIVGTIDNGVDVIRAVLLQQPAVQQLVSRDQDRRVLRVLTALGVPLADQVTVEAALDAAELHTALRPGAEGAELVATHFAQVAPDE